MISLALACWALKSQLIEAQLFNDVIEEDMDRQGQGEKIMVLSNSEQNSGY